MNRSTTDMRYREIRETDVEALFDLRSATRENAMTRADLQDWGIMPETITAGLAANLKGWLCESKGQVVGFAMGDARTGEMLVVAVLPEYEGRGIWKQLMVRVQDWLFSQGHEELFLLENPDPNVRAFGFYRRLGWTASVETADDHGVLRLRRRGSARGT